MIESVRKGGFFHFMGGEKIAVYSIYRRTKSNRKQRRTGDFLRLRGEKLERAGREYKLIYNEWFGQSRQHYNSRFYLVRSQKSGRRRCDKIHAVPLRNGLSDGCSGTAGTEDRASVSCSARGQLFRKKSQGNLNCRKQTKICTGCSHTL